MKKIEIEIPDDSILVQEGDKYIIKKKDDKPRSWEEFCEKYPRTKDEYFICDDSAIDQVYNTIDPRHAIDDKNICTSKEEAEAFLALMQLRQLRKAWVGNWKQTIGWCAIIAYNLDKQSLEVGYSNYYWNYALSFPTQEMADEFMNCFKDLCEKAKILL